MDNAVLHDEFGSGISRAGLVLTGASLAFAGIEAILGFPNDALGLIVGLLGSIVGLTLWGVSRYSGVRLTGDYLQVGGEKLRRGELDTAFGVRRGEALTDKERALVESPLPIPKSATVRVPGGAFGRIAGTDLVVLRAAGDAKKLALSSRRPDELTEALQRWLAEHP